jgi:hypothetical protein
MEKANTTMPLSRFIFGLIITALIFPAVILFAAGDWLWLEGWIFALWFAVRIARSSPAPD